jgi:membrane AbrB-like protein
VLVVLSVAVALGLLRLGFPGGLIFGPMLASAVLHGGAFISVKLPMWVAVAGMAGLGAVNGSRFTDTPLRLLLDYLAAALGSFVVAIAVGGAFALAVTWLMGLPISDVIVAYAPGSVDAMMIMALALHLDPVFVGAHHLARVLTVTLAMPFVVRQTARRAGRSLKRKRRPMPAETALDD